jgi:hypothetical protein
MAAKTTAQIASETHAFISAALACGFNISFLGRCLRLTKKNAPGDAAQFQQSVEAAHLLLARIPAKGDIYGSGFGGYGDVLDLQNGTFCTSLCGVNSRYASALKKDL